MHSLCKDDKLHVQNEGQLLRLIDRYLEVRENNKNLPLLDEETDAVIGAKKNWEEEKAAEEGKDDLWKANRPIHNFNEKERAACTDRLKMSRLTKAEKKDLYGCVRFVHMPHEELIGLSVNEKYAVCREYITEALSFKLNRYENAIKDNLQYNNANYRVNAEPTAEESAWQDRSQGNAFSSQAQPTAGQAPPA
jgi:hypothetical protein